MYPIWLKGLTDTQAADFKGAVSSAQKVLERIVNVLEEEEDKINERRLTREAYDRASWPYFQADVSGEARQNKRIKTLISNLILGK